MAILANSFSSYDMVGDREDLSDTIYDISPTDTPFMSNAGRAKAKNTLFEWQTDSLAAVDTANKQLEGDDNPSMAAVSPTTRIANVTQISRKTLAITETEQVVDKAGRKDEWAYQIAKRGSELKRDIESILIATNQAADLGSEAAGRATASLSSFIRTNTNFDATSGSDPAAPNPTPADARNDSSATRAFTETILKSIVQEAWVSGADIGGSSLMVSGTQKQTVSTFTGIATRFKDVGKGQATIVGAADIYVSDFGTFSVVPNRWMRTRDAFLIDWSYVDIAYLRPFKAVELAKTGDNKKGMLIVEYGLKVKNEAALAGVYDLS
jgi:hypothetical protein